MPRGSVLPVHADEGGVVQLRRQPRHRPVRRGEDDQAAQVPGEVRAPARLPPRGQGAAQLPLWRVPPLQTGELPGFSGAVGSVAV